ncbi:helix-turn-helix transcriptional regulator [Streptomyces sp. NPDC051940]|uniref:helix-turn-helix transcriptional regulator n=1 Tax=Streptomyces sp. NPDC051940 TaxID=3155675 RepID=UPI00341D5530
MLEPLGLEADAETVYRLLLEQPDWSVEDMAAHLNLAPAAVHEALDALADLRLLVPSDDGPGRLLPVSPEVGLAALLSRKELELHSLQRQMDSTRAAVADLTTRYGGRKQYAPEMVHTLFGLDAVRNRLAELAEAARTECLSFFPGGSQLPDTMESSKPLDQLALERGVALRTLYQDSFRNDPATLQYVRWLASLGGQTRTVPSLPMLMVLVDREVALVPIDPDDGRRGALELRSHGVVAALHVLFERFWASAQPWHEPDQPDDRGLTRRDRELLTLLASGHTDEYISRKLGLSLRTVRRSASALMERLQARSRFEAGVLAVRAGWL